MQGTQRIPPSLVLTPAAHSLRRLPVSRLKESVQVFYTKKTPDSSGTETTAGRTSQGRVVNPKMSRRALFKSSLSRDFRKPQSVDLLEEQVSQKRIRARLECYFLPETDRLCVFSATTPWQVKTNKASRYDAGPPQSHRIFSTELEGLTTSSSRRSLDRQMLNPCTSHLLKKTLNPTVTLWEQGD